MEKMLIVVWRGVIVDYLSICRHLGCEIVREANADELKQYWSVRERDKEIDL